MGMFELESFLDLVDEGDSDFVGPRAEVLIASAEAMVGVRFPPTYRRFLAELGAGDVAGEEFYGIVSDDFVNSGVPDAIWMTLRARGEWSLPPSMVVVYFDGMGGYFVLDCAEPTDDGEYPVKVWQPGSAQPGDALEVVGPDFGTVALRLVQHALGAS